MVLTCGDVASVLANLYDTVVQREVSLARLTKPASCYTLRHSFATHLLKNNLR